MTTATLTRGGTSVDLPLVRTGGNPLIIRDFGKPEINIQPSGGINPRHIDQWSGIEQITLVGKFIDANAYSDAIALADLIKSHPDGTPITLSIDVPEFTDAQVVPGAGQDGALSLEYQPGSRNMVNVNLSLTKINQTLGNADQVATTPTSAGSGPIQLSYQGTTVDLVNDITVTRDIGRPNDVVRRVPNTTYPNHIAKFKTASDLFELSTEFNSNTVSTIQDLISLFQTQLGRNSLTLDFNGLYGMGAFNVVPEGSGALRHVRQSGEQGTAIVPTISLRRVL